MITMLQCKGSFQAVRLANGFNCIVQVSHSKLELSILRYRTGLGKERERGTNRLFFFSVVYVSY